MSAGTGSSAWTVGLVALDNGTCGTNLQLGSDKTASYSATPTFWLQGNGGLSKYDVYIDGTYIGRFSSDGWANVCITTTNRLSDGAHRLTGNEIQPNAANVITPLNFSVDTVPPAPTSTPAMMAFSDAGIVGDNITKFRTFTMSGTSDPGMTIQLTQNDLVMGGAAADASGNWSAAGTVFSDGVYQVKAVAIDPASNRSASSGARQVTVDSVVPGATLLNPAANATVAGTVPITVDANDAGVGVWKIEWKVDNFVRSTLTGAPTITTNPATFNWNSASVGNGSHTLVQVVTDLAGNVTTLPATTVNVLNGQSSVPTAPTLNSASAANSSVTLAWSAPSSNGGSAITSYMATASPGGAFCSTAGAQTCTVSGLTNGVTYSFTVTASNAIGTGPASNALTATPSAPVSVPSAPTLSSATRGNGSVSLAWIAPSSNGGSAITGYTATASPGGATCTTAGTTCTVSNLTNGTSYSFTVTATNAVGTGPASNALSATPATTPSAPTLTSATAGNGMVTLVWSAPYDGGSPITGYTAGASPSGLTCVTTGTTCTITGLTNGTSYMFTVTGANAVGVGLTSNVLFATPGAPASAPSAPTLNSATRGNASATLAWSAPLSDGGSAITTYTATASPGGATCSTSGLTCTVSGLTNGTTYSFTVAATNAVGTGPASNSLPATPATLPGAPTLNSATRGDGAVTAAWSAPLSNGGSAITSYTATASPGGATCTTGALSCTISSLANGTTYTITVTALNGVGTGAASNSLAATPATTPGAPSLNSATRGNGFVSLAWTAGSNGGSAITSYTATSSPGGFTCSTSALSCSVSGLTNGVTYSFTVTATNALGTGPASNPLSATPATTPGAPTLNSLSRGNGTISAFWSAPASNGGSAITSYTATASNGSNCSTTGTSCTISGLTNGTSYSVTVTATNALGTGAASNALSATPATTPGAPTLNSASPGNGSVSLGWTAPASNGGSAITAYTATASPGGATCTTAGTSCAVSGLANGTTYSFTVVATNAMGNGSASNAMNATPVAPAGTPSAPTLNSANRGNGFVTLSWSAPLSDGGSPITLYAASAQPSGNTCTTTTALTCTIAGLTNGTTYSFTVTASNAVGPGPASNVLSATPATLPGAPAFTSATAGNSSVALAWTAPFSNGGSAITFYTVTALPGGSTCSTVGLGCTVSGLINGTTYTFTVTASNAVGTGPASSPITQTPVAPATVPSAPSLNSLSRSNGSITAFWSAPSSNGGSAITSYTATAAGGGSCTTSTLSCTISGLTNGTLYTVTVKATNAVGSGPDSNSLSTTPATTPGAPSLNSLSRGNTTITAFWSAPASNGGSAITSYTATASNGMSCSTSGLNCTITGLTNGTTYSVTVTASNALGTGAASNALSATPATTPSAPTLTSATAGDGRVTLVWSAPYDGGSPITGYTAGASPSGLTCSTTGTTCTITGLTNGTNYMFTVTGANAVGVGGTSNVLTATPTAPTSVPGAPTLSSATAGNGNATLSWSAPASDGGSAITGYVATASPGGATCSTSGLGCTIFGLTNGVTYQFTVTATNAVGTGAASNALSATPMTVPGAPTLNSAVPGNSVTLSWSAPTSTGGSAVTGYRIYRGTAPGATFFLTSVGNVTSYTDETTTSGTTYYFAVAAVTAAGEGAKSNELSATPTILPSDPTPPSQPGQPKAIALGTSQVALDWTASTDNVGVTGYNILVNGTVLATTTTSHGIVSGLRPATTYTVTIQAFDAAANKSQLSTSTSAKTASLGTGTTGTLAGATLDAAASKILANVTVKTTLANGAAKSTKSNNSGKWSMSNMPAGTYTMTATLSGYQTVSWTMTLTSGQTILALAELSR